MTHEDPILIVGAGQAGATAAEALRTLGHAGPIVMVGREQSLPYERPPLSKVVLSDAAMDERILIHPIGFHRERLIEMRLGMEVLSIDAARSLALCGNGESLSFSRCLIATGGKARTLPGLPEGTARVHYVRTLNHAQGLRRAMLEQRSVLVLGGGFLGLEIASTARDMGLAVTVVESASRVLERAVPPEFSAWLQQRIRHAGIDLRLDCRCTSIDPQTDGITLTLEGDNRLHTPLLVVAIGLLPEIALARASGLELHPLNGGIRIDAQGRTSAPGIFAAGDCTSQFQPLCGEEMRLESWQSANEQARVAAATMLNLSTGPAAVPWFWTDQLGCNVQMLGMPVSGLGYQRRGDSVPDGASPKFLLLGFDAERRLRHVVAVNAGADLRQLRALVERRTPCEPELLGDPSLPLRQLVRDAIAAAPHSQS